MSTKFPQVNITFDEEKDNSTRLTIEPLERGYGSTVGNALRRVLLGSIPGFAVTRVHIAGVQFEYDTIDGVREDVLAILLNLKALSVRLGDGQDEVELTLKAKGKGAVKASQIGGTKQCHDH